MDFTTNPQCPHCKKPFATWEQAKRHVKYCAKGAHPRMPREDFFKGGKSLKAGDIKDGQLVTIEEFTSVKTRLGVSPLLRFKGMDSAMFLNATNYDRMVEKYGNDEKKWSGKKIRLIIRRAPNPSNGGREQDVIRIE